MCAMSRALYLAGAVGTILVLVNPQLLFYTDKNHWAGENEQHDRN